ncbi:hypothetical protein EYF80_012984 [Liparis tanakae]|uniref:Uncharacterized protein n=1 Tax=Liparis tanakae TaxID=230148 RepID=A0A4Z2IGE8_9TELE|nr:hypothetical protein EYF80_012984 [Liparis tanakae]
MQASNYLLMQSRRLISGQRLVTLPQDVHTASWQTLGLVSAAVSSGAIHELDRVKTLQSCQEMEKGAHKKEV